MIIKIMLLILKLDKYKYVGIASLQHKKDFWMSQNSKSKFSIMVTIQIYSFTLCFSIFMFLMHPPQRSFRNRTPKLSDFYKRPLF